MISETITKEIGEALKAHKEVRLSTLRLLSSALNYEFIAKQHRLSEEEELAVVRREAKKRREAIEIYEKAKAQDRAEREKEELIILAEFLPPEMPEEELQKLVETALAKTQAKTPAEMGKVIGLVMGQAKGMADGAKVAALVKAQLTHD
jgi:uncharacterized protein YqeY